MAISDQDMLNFMENTLRAVEALATEIRDISARMDRLERHTAELVGQNDHMAQQQYNAQRITPHNQLAQQMGTSRERDATAALGSGMMGSSYGVSYSETKDKASEAIEEASREGREF